MFATLHDAFADHYRRSDEPFEAWKTRLLGHPNFVPELWALAWDDAAGEAAGAVIAYDHGDLGWVQGLGVRPAWRRRGLGAALLAHVLAAFKARGQLRVDLSVDAEGATRPLHLYERAGMQDRAPPTSCSRSRWSEAGELGVAREDIIRRCARGRLSPSAWV